MTRKSSKSHNSHDLSRCRHFFPGGRRCRLSLSSHSRFYCRSHAHLQPPAGAVVDLSGELMAGVQKLTSASDINKFLSKILILLAQDRISPRRASVLAYTCNLLFRTLPAIEREQHPKRVKHYDDLPVVWDIPGPDHERRNHPQPLPPPSAAPRSPQPPAPAVNAAPAELRPERQNNNVVPPPQSATPTQSAYNSFMRAEDTLDNALGRNIRFRRHRVS
jgi:hypothetical protein